MAQEMEFHEVPFCTHLNGESEWTLGDPIEVIWSSINSLCATDLSEGLASRVYGCASKKDLKRVSKNIRLYIKQANSFYYASKQATANTSPLMAYYAFLNLSKAACELVSPDFHQSQENYNHGASWRPNRDYMVNVYSEEVKIPDYRGVWHSIWEISSSDVYTRQGKPISISVKDLFLACPEVSVESGTVFGGYGHLMSLQDPCFLESKDGKIRRIRFSISKVEMGLKKVSKNKLLKQICYNGVKYRVAESDDEGFIFESSDLAFKKNDISCDFYCHLRQLRIFTEADGSKEMSYSLCDQSKFPVPLSQMALLYTILFWLGSLVRYDPHSVDDLMNSREWVLVQGFMSQSTLWLLQQFRWLIFRSEISIWRAW